VPNLPSDGRHRGGMDQAIDRDVEVRSSSPVGHHGGLEGNAHRFMIPDPVASGHAIPQVGRWARGD
jgi:hypothetical protein